jgi:hypothetical protein
MVPSFVVLPKRFQFVDHSIIVRNYDFYNLNQLNMISRENFNILSKIEHEILNTFGNPFHSFTFQKRIVFS